MNSTDLCPPFPRREAPWARQAAAEVAPGQGTPGSQQGITTLFSAMASPGQGARAPVRLSASPSSPGQPHSCCPDVLNYLSLLHGTGSPQKAGTASPSLLSSTVCRQPGASQNACTIQTTKAMANCILWIGILVQFLNSESPVLH